MFFQSVNRHYMCTRLAKTRCTLPEMFPTYGWTASGCQLEWTMAKNFHAWQIRMEQKSECTGFKIMAHKRCFAECCFKCCRLKCCRPAGVPVVVRHATVTKRNRSSQGHGSKNPCATKQSEEGWNQSVGKFKKIQTCYDNW